MYLSRTRFSRDIVAEFLPPSRIGTKAVILCDGMPSVPSKKPLLQFLSRKGFWVFHPRYRGSWESGGRFLAQSPEKDIRQVIDGIHRPFLDLFTGKKVAISPRKIFLISSSFGGPAALLNSSDDRVSGVVSFSPVVDWRRLGRAEPLDWVQSFSKNAFGEAYRFKASHWRKLGREGFYNPVDALEKISGEKILIFQNKDDKSVSWAPVYGFAKRVGAQIVLRSRGGHLGNSELMKLGNWKKVASFFQSL